MSANSIYERYFRDHLAAFPLTATLLGEHRWDGECTDIYSEEHHQAYQMTLQRYSKELEQLVGDNLPNIEQRAFRYQLDMSLESYDYSFELLPISQMNNIYTMMTELIRDYQTVTDTKGLEQLRSRMKGFQNLANSLNKRLLQGMKEGIVQPKCITEQVIQQLETLLQDQPYLDKPVPDSIRPSFQRLMNRRFTPAIEETLEFLKKYYLHLSRDTIGYGNLPNGKAMYKFLLRQNTTREDLSVEDVHQIGISETSRILTAKEALADTLPIKDLMGNGDFVLKSREAVLEMYRAEQDRIHRDILPRYFGSLAPKRDYKIEAVPKYTEEFQSTAYYIPPSLDGARQGTFYVNLRNLEEHPTYKAEVLSLHEGNPGHHFQIALSVDRGVPNYRAYGDWTAFFEGWGLYTENLGDYRDGYSKLGKYNYELMRSIRLVVDTGIHMMGWSVEKCRGLFKSATDLVESEIDAEIYRYISMPGQALSYKIGEKSILDIRDAFLEKHRGDQGRKNAIQAFHQKLLLTGPLPLGLLRTHLLGDDKST